MIVREGSVTIETPGTGQEKGPGKAEPGFYNRSQKLNRDLTILFLNWAKPKLALDGFGGTGIRGIRFSVEARTRTVISERNTVSAKVIEKNIMRNNSDNELQNESFECSLSRSLFDFIDIDPYGTAVQYMDQAIASVKNNGFIAVTATDLSALTGSVPKKTMLRYGASVMNDAFRHETGARVLAGIFARKAASLEREAIPMLTVWHSHYYRIIFRVRSGTGRAAENMNNVGFINKHVQVSKHYPNVLEGPLWIGRLFSKDFLDSMEIPGYLAGDRTLQKYTEMFRNEDTGVLFCDIAEIGRLMHDSPIRLDDAIEILNKNGYGNAGRTHFSPTGIKTEANMDRMISFMYGKGKN